MWLRAMRPESKNVWVCAVPVLRGYPRHLSGHALLHVLACPAIELSC